MCPGSTSTNQPARKDRAQSTDGRRVNERHRHDTTFCGSWGGLPAPSLQLLLEAKDVAIAGRSDVLEAEGARRSLLRNKNLNETRCSRLFCLFFFSTPRPALEERTCMSLDALFGEEWHD